MRAIEAADLVRWADQKDCRERLPELVLRLLKETCVSATFDPALGGEPILLTENVQGSRWAFEAPAYWIMSSASSPSRAARDALSLWTEASRLPAAGDRELVFVTVRLWSGKQRWINRVRQEVSSGNIRVYDAEDLARWLAEAPKTVRWFFEEVLEERNPAVPARGTETTPEMARWQAREEMKRWRELGNTVPGLTDRDALVRLAALAVVRGPFDSADIHRMAERLPDLGLGSPNSVGRRVSFDAITPWLPAPVAAAFVVEALDTRPDRAPEWLWEAIDGVEAHALTRLERLAYDSEVTLGIRQPRLADWLVAMVEADLERAPRFAPHLVDYWLPIGLVPFYMVVAQVMYGEALDKGKQANCLIRLAQCEAAGGDHNTALLLIKDAVTLCRKLAADDPKQFEPDLSVALLRLSSTLWHVGDQEQARAVTREAVEIGQRLAVTNPERFEPVFVSSLNNLSNLLSDTGDKEEALTAIREAVEIGLRLAVANPARFEPDLAMSLNNLSNHLSSAGDREGALTANREAVAIQRRLAQANPARFEPDLASSLNNLSNHLSDTGDKEGALTAICEAVEIRRRLAQANPTRFEPDLALSLNNLSVHLSSVEDRAGALTAIRETLHIQRRLTEVNPERFEPDLALSSYNLSVHLSSAGDRVEALTAVREALEIQRRLTEANPARFEPDLARSLRLLSRILSDLGRTAEARAADREAKALEKKAPQPAVPPEIPPPPLSIDPLKLAYLLVLNNRAPPPLLMRPDAEAMAEALAGAGPEAGGDLDQVVAGLAERYPGAAPNPLWLAWMGETQPGLADRLRTEIPALWVRRGGTPARS